MKHQFVWAWALACTVTLPAMAELRDMAVVAAPDTAGEAQYIQTNALTADVEDVQAPDTLSGDHPHRFSVVDGQGRLVKIVNATYITVETDKPVIYLSDIVNTNGMDSINTVEAQVIRIRAASR